MDWTLIIEEIFRLIILPIIGIAGVYLTYFISAKIKDLKKKTNDDNAKKYLDFLDSAVSNAVLATTQTYVESLKSQGKFDMEAQKVAFNQTYDAVMKVLTADAIKVINEVIGDVETYVTNKIEAEVKINKSFQ